MLATNEFLINLNPKGRDVGSHFQWKGADIYNGTYPTFLNRSSVLGLERELKLPENYVRGCWVGNVRRGLLFLIEWREQQGF